MGWPSLSRWRWCGHGITLSEGLSRSHDRRSSERPHAILVRQLRERFVRHLQPARHLPRSLTEVIDQPPAALIPGYRILRRLGEGGMATVYLADDLKHDRRVALKVLRPELAAVLGADRFLSEIKTTAGL